MTKRLCAFGLIVLIVASTNGVLLACGDKFLVSNRGTRFQRAAALRQAAEILVYSPSEANVVAGASIDATLRKAGYRPTTIATSVEFENALSRGGWDIVLVTATEAQAVSRRLSNTVVVPIIFNATKTELAQTKKQYKVVLKAPAKSQSFLSAIDEALAHKPKSQAKSI